MSDEISFWGNDAGKLINGIGFPILIGIVATFVRMNRFGVRYSWAQWITAICTSSFIAILTYWGLDFLDLQPTVDAAIVGVASYMGTSILDAFMTRVRWQVKHGDLGPAHGDHAPMQDDEGGSSK